MENKYHKTLFKYCAILILLAFALFRINFLASALSTVFGLLKPFLIGWFLAIVFFVPMTPIENFLNAKVFKKSRKNLSRSIALIITIILFIIILYFISALVIPELAKTIIKFSENIPKLVDNFFNWVEEINESENSYYYKFKDTINDFSLNLKMAIENISKNAVSRGLNFLGNTLSLIFTIFLVLSFAIYSVFYKENLKRASKKALYAFFDKNTAGIIEITAKRIILNITNFIGGTAIESLIFGAMLFISMTILNFPYKTTISICGILTTFIPYFGAFLSGLIGFVLIAVIDIKKSLLFVVLIVFLQQFEGNIIYPKVVGEQVGLPGIWVMMSVAIGGSVFGIFGMILAVPIATLIYKTLGDIVEYKTRKKEGKDLSLSEVMKISYSKEI